MYYFVHPNLSAWRQKDISLRYFLSRLKSSRNFRSVRNPFMIVHSAAPQALFSSWHLWQCVSAIKDQASLETGLFFCCLLVFLSFCLSCVQHFTPKVRRAWQSARLVFPLIISIFTMFCKQSVRWPSIAKYRWQLNGWL